MILKICCFSCIFFAVFLQGSRVDALSCYQGQHKYGANLTDVPPKECPMPSQSCILSMDWSRSLFIVACQRTSCTMLDGGSYKTSDSDICKSSTSYQPQQTYCCCYGDGCNGQNGENGLLTKMYATNSSDAQQQEQQPRSVPDNNANEAVAV